MRKLFKTAILGFSIMLASCANNPQPVVYQEQEPIRVPDGSSSFLMDYVLYQSLINSNQNPANYYHNHRNDVHIHVYNGHGYNGYRGRYSTVFRPIVVRRTPNYNNVSRSTNYYNRARTTVTPVIRNNINRPVSSYNRPVTSYKPSTGGYNRSSSSISRSYNRSSGSSFGRSRH